MTKDEETLVRITAQIQRTFIATEKMMKEVPERVWLLVYKARYGHLHPGLVARVAALKMTPEEITPEVIDTIVNAHFHNMGNEMEAFV